MNIRVINPYAKVVSRHRESLDYIIAHLPPNPGFDELNAQLVASFFEPDPENETLGNLFVDALETVLPNLYNAYVHGSSKGKGFANYSEAQQRLIAEMLEGVVRTPAEAISDFLDGMEEKIVVGDFSFAEQMPLLLACAIGKSDSAYWQEQIATPGAWTPYLNSDNAINYMHVNSWVAASLQGALLNYRLLPQPEIPLVDGLTSIVGATGLVAGKVVFGWVG